MASTANQPLWEVLRRAYDASPLAPMDADDDWTDRHGYAAEIRAVADAIPKQFYGAGGVRAWLLEEADRAECPTPTIENKS